MSTALREWMRDHGEDIDTLSSAQAIRWLGCAEHARLCAKAAELPLGKRGPSARRPTIAERYRIGRTVHKAFNRMQGLRGDDGQIVQDPAVVDQMLWDSRRGLWGSVPPCPGSPTRSCGPVFVTGALSSRTCPDRVTRTSLRRCLRPAGLRRATTASPTKPIIRESSS